MLHIKSDTGPERLYFKLNDEEEVLRAIDSNGYRFFFATSRPLTVVISGESIEKFYEIYSNLPRTTLKHVCYNGELAKFIVDNLKYYADALRV